MYLGVHIKYPVSYQILMKLEISQETFEKILQYNIYKKNQRDAAWQYVCL